MNDNHTNYMTVIILYAFSFISTVRTYIYEKNNNAKHNKKFKKNWE